jgi:hypothetical protein
MEGILKKAVNDLQAEQEWRTGTARPFVAK